MSAIVLDIDIAHLSSVSKYSRTQGQQSIAMREATNFISYVAVTKRSFCDSESAYTQANSILRGHHMQRYAATLLCLMLAPSTMGQSLTTTRNVQDLERLLVDVKRIAPIGWDVAFDPAERYLGNMRPVLTITSEMELPVQHFGAGMPTGLPPVEHEKVKLWLAFMAYQPIEQYAATHQRNTALTRQRQIFFRERLGGVEFGHKGEGPPPPMSFRPRSPEQQRIVDEYSFLWLATEPERLPSHHYGTLSMWYSGTDSIKIGETKRNEEYEQIAKKLEQILTPYTLDEVNVNRSDVKSPSSQRP